MQTKILEVRDRMTMMSVIAVNLDPKTTNLPVEEWHLIRTGYAWGHPTIMLAAIDGGVRAAQTDPYEWPGTARTLREAHKYIEKNWAGLQSGDVVDVEFILGESLEVKQSEFK